MSEPFKFPPERRLDVITEAWDEPGGDSQADIHHVANNWTEGADLCAVVSCEAARAALSDPTWVLARGPGDVPRERIRQKDLADYWGVQTVEISLAVPSRAVIVYPAGGKARDGVIILNTTAAT